MRGSAFIVLLLVAGASSALEPRPDTDATSECSPSGAGPESLYLSASCFREHRKLDRAADLYAELQRRFPASAHAPEALFFQAEIAETTFDLDGAIDRYRQFVEAFPGSHDAPKAQLRLARHLELLNLPRDAAAAYERYAEIFPDQTDAADMRFTSAILYGRVGDSAGHIRRLRAFLRRYGRDARQREHLVMARFEVAKALLVLNDRAGALRELRRTVDDFSRFRFTYRDEEGNRAAAAAAFFLADAELLRFEHWHPKFSVASSKWRDIPPEVFKLLELKQGLSKQFGEIIQRYRDPSTMRAALCRLDSINTSFFDKLLAGSRTLSDKTNLVRNAGWDGPVTEEIPTQGDLESISQECDFRPAWLGNSCEGLPNSWQTGQFAVLPAAFQALLQTAPPVFATSGLIRADGTYLR